MAGMMLIQFLFDVKLGRTDGALQGSPILACTIASHHCKTGKPHTGMFKNSILEKKHC